MGTASNMSRRVLAFDSTKKLVAVYTSAAATARQLGVTRPTVSSVCNGKSISTKNFYLRWWHPEIDIDVSQELGLLSLMEYDTLTGDMRKTYCTGKMRRKDLKLKYNMKVTDNKLRKINLKNESTDNQQLTSPSAQPRD